MSGRIAKRGQAYFRKNFLRHAWCRQTDAPHMDLMLQKLRLVSRPMNGRYGILFIYLPYISESQNPLREWLGVSYPYTLWPKAFRQYQFSQRRREQCFAHKIKVVSTVRLGRVAFKQHAPCT